MSSEQEVNAKIAQIDANPVQEQRVKGYLELLTRILDAKKFPLFKIIFNHCKHSEKYICCIVLREEVPTTVSKPVLSSFAKI